MNTPPHGCTWGRYVALLVDAHGGWSALVDLLIHRAGQRVELPEDPQSIERGLRRLARRDNAPGGQYGRWLLRFFGVPQPLEVTAQWMGQYHSRFADLPVSTRELHLWLWDRPPICEATVSAWIHLGLASVAMRRGDMRAARDRLGRVNAHTPAAGAEADLLAARLASDDGDREAASQWLDRAQARLDDIADADQRDCYLARVLDQRAYAVLHPAGGAPRRVADALALYADIPAACPVPFVRFRRAHGLAYCHWKLGDTAAALDHVRAASEHAGDGGLIRFRAMALDLMAHMVPDEQARELRARAETLARQIEHEDLLAGIQEP